MFYRRTVSHGAIGLPHAHRLAPHIVDAEPTAWFGRDKTGRRGGNRSGRLGFVIGLIGGSGLGLLMHAVTQGL